MIKIAVVNVFFPPQTIGGATRVVSDNVDALLSNYSDDVEVVGFCTQSDCRKAYSVEVYPYKGIRVYRANSNFRENMDWHPRDDEFYKIFTDFLEFEKPDIVHFHCVQRMTASVVEAALDLGVPYVITAHDAWWISDYQFLTDQFGNVYPNGHSDIYEKRSYPEGISATQSLERLIYLKKLLKGAAKVLHVSESFERLYNNNGIANTFVTKNGISSSVDWLPKQTSDNPKVVLGHIGGMSDHKGFDIFKSALEQADGGVFEALVVDHSQEPGYVRYDSFGSVTVKYIGRQAQDQVVNLYQQLDVLFAPSKWPESFGLVTREALACGCWIVASNIGGIGEDVNNLNGFVVPPSLESLIVVLSKMSEDVGKYKKQAESDGLVTSDVQARLLYENIYREVVL